MAANNLTSKTYTEDGMHIITPSSGNQNNGVVIQFSDLTKLGLNWGDVITASVDVKGETDNNESAIHIRYNNTTATQWWSGGGNEERFLANGNWQRVSLTITLPEYKDSFNNNYLWIVLSNAYYGDMYWKNLKLEKGNTAKVWSPNPEDSDYDSELATIIYDNSGLGYNGTINGNLLFSKDSAEGEYSLDARGEDFISYIRCESAPQLEKDFTWNVWVKQNDATTPHTLQMIASQGRDYTNYGMNLSVVNGKPRIYVGNVSENKGITMTAKNAIDNNWHMITGLVSEDSQQAKLYVDAVLQDTYYSRSTNGL